MAHAFVTIAIPFEADRQARVDAELSRLGNPAGPVACAALGRAGIFHFVSMNAIAAEPGGAAHLIIELSADGPADDAVATFVDAMRDPLESVIDAAGIAWTPPLEDLLLRHRIRTGPGWLAPAGLDFTGTPGMSVRRILMERDLANRVRGLVTARGSPGTALSHLDTIRATLWGEGYKEAFAPEPTPCLNPPPALSRLSFGLKAVLAALGFLWPLIVAAGAFALLAAGLLAVLGWTPGWLATIGIAVLAIVSALVAGALLLRAAERRDTPSDTPAPAERLRAVIARENHAAQNHLMGVSPLKPGLLRRLTLRLALRVIGFMAAHAFRPGYLSGIGSIHFARWVLLPGTSQLLFMSNYGGSWESYLEDFIQKAHAGLTGVWSNTEGFPRTSNLFQDGATDGDTFKRWARVQQVPTAFWFSAYPDLTTARIRSNAAIRLGLAAAVTEAQAADWMSLFGSAPRPPDLLDAAEIPSLVFGGLSPLRFGAALVLRFGEDPEASRRWLAGVEPTLAFGDRVPEGEARLIAFSAGGLRRLGLSDDAMATFPLVFQDGMRAPTRARLLGDPEPGPNSGVRWSDGDSDALLLVYAQSPTRLERCLRDVRRSCAAAGILVSRRIAMEPLPPKPAPGEARRPFREPFGFVDGVSQPAVRGTRRFTGRERIHIVEPGEFVLGYPDNRNRLPPSPSLGAAEDPAGFLPAAGADAFRPRPDVGGPQPCGRRDLGANGTYLAVRQLEQDVAGFDAYLDQTSARLHGDPRLPPGSLAELREWIAAKLVGRWRDGNPLVREPHGPGAARSRPDNDFTYGEEDPAGLRCPLGAHIRRVNPRDSLDPRSKDQLAISNRHRILRVGRVYGRPGAERGLLFMCLNADIERQFEFVQQTWAQAPGFHGLDGEVDCFGPRGSTDRMTVPTPHGPLCIERLQDFVTLRGGGYFFLPGRRALHFLAQSLGSGAPGIGERGLVAGGAGAPAQA